MAFEFGRLAVCLVSSITMSALVHWIVQRGDVAREAKWLREENRRLKWIVAQMQMPDLGPHRSIHVKTLRGTPPFEDHREDLMRDQPAPTSVPSAGRRMET